MSEFNLSHYLLLAMPDMADPHFAHSVVYIVEHDKTGAFGVIVNKTLATRVADVARELELPYQGEQDTPALYGGPVANEQGFILFEPLLKSADTPGFTSSTDMLEGFVNDPHSRFMLILGYAGWGPGQLEKELQENGWLTVESDNDILFHTPPEERYQKALRKLGIDPVMMSNHGGSS